MTPTKEQIDAAASAIHAANRNNSGLTFSDLVRKMAEAALDAAAQVDTSAALTDQKGDRYARALAALQTAHDACFENDKRDVLGMSHGPFSGVNVALGIIRQLEGEVARLTRRADTYLIWSNEHSAWWRPNSCGYTVELEAAGRYSRAEAIAIASNARDGWAKGKAPPEIALPERDALEALATARRPG